LEHSFRAPEAGHRRCIAQMAGIWRTCDAILFDVKNGHRLIDLSGVDCRDDKAIEAGAMIARQIAQSTANRSGSATFTASPRRYPE
jgi:hypothetical protein